MDQNRLQLIIELDLQVDAMQKNNINLEKALSWIKIRDDAVVRNIFIGIDAPKQCLSGDGIHLPGGFLAKKRPPMKTESAASSREIFEVVQAGDPFAFVQTESDVFHLVDSLMKHTFPLRNFPDGSAIAASSCLEQAVLQSESCLLQACCLFLQSECLEEDFSLCSVMKLLRSWEDDNIDLNVTSITDILFHDLELREPDHPAVSAYASFKTVAGIRIAEHAVVSCIHRLKTLNLTSLSEIIADMKTP